jgi:prepilin-type N-terminal cleavage/methylation domain-containing protein
MSIPQPSKFRAGFTLVELLIVVIILAILAAIVIPQFSSATRDTKDAAIDSNLASVRNAIELYKVQHNDWPGKVATTAGATCTTGPGSASAGTQEAFVQSLTMFSDKTGKTCSVQVNEFRFGPYIRKELPMDPLTDSRAVVVSTAGTPIAPAAATGGWAFDTTSGQFVMNSNALDGKTATSTYAQR